jgi:starch synthase (maltosyl-transferring)
MTSKKKAPPLSPAAPAFSRVAIEHVRPQVDDGRFPIRRVQGETVTVSAFIHADGHDALTAVLRYRQKGGPLWQEAFMTLRGEGTDVWDADFALAELGIYEYTVQAWVDEFGSLKRDLIKKIAAGQDVGDLVEEIALLFDKTAPHAPGIFGERLRASAKELRRSDGETAAQAVVTAPGLADAARRSADRRTAATSDRIYEVLVERPRALTGAWYEMFPRSTSPDPKRPGTLKDCADRLSYVAEMGFDVVYLPPIHPIGDTFRKGPNNTLKAGPNDPGSPWAIGNKTGGHMAVHPDLGTLADFDALVAEARRLRMEIALDIAFQCSPDHPYVTEHPEWFKHRPDGTIKYAENPPKKYQDIYPFDFECAAWPALWEELKNVFLFWAKHGVRTFRVDNPHTKPFRFWEWVIREVRIKYPDAIFLSEAFTRPPVLKYLAKVGFSQSYSYFTWRNSKRELTTYFTELTGAETREFLRPNLFVNTPDILHEYLQSGGRPAHQIRLVLAATLGASYGVYGPTYELGDNRAIPGTEDYRDSEKYQVRHWAIESPDSLKDFIAQINGIRRENPALRANGGLKFHAIDNDNLIAYSKMTSDGTDLLLVVVNLDPFNAQSGWILLPVSDWGIGSGESYQVHDLLSDARYFWHGDRNYIRLDPSVCPAHIFRVRRKIKSERDFDYFL